MQGVVPAGRESSDAETVCGHGAERQRHVLVLGRPPQGCVAGLGVADAKSAAWSLKPEARLDSGAERLRTTGPKNDHTRRNSHALHATYVHIDDYESGSIQILQATSAQFDTTAASMRVNRNRATTVRK